MKTENQKIWKGEPWSDFSSATLPRPSEKVRNNIYALAREKANKKSTRFVSDKIIAILRDRYSYVLWSAAAILLITTCVWLGNTGRDISANKYAANNIEKVADEVVNILNDENFSPLTEQDGADIEEVKLFVEIQTINEGLASIENNLQLTYLF